MLLGWRCWAAANESQGRPPLFPSLDLGLPGLAVGEVLLAELHCTACHLADPPVLARLRPQPAPRLDGVADRLRPLEVRRWLLDPAGSKPGTTMPAVLLRLPGAQRATVAEELTQFLWSLAPRPGHAPPTPAPLSPFLQQQGRVLYHQIGCVACHPPFESAREIFGQHAGGPTDPGAVAYVLGQLQAGSQPLPNLAAKYQPEGLARFLLNPLAVRPGGRMPAMNLTEAEARAITAYLLGEHARTHPAPDPDPAWALDPAKASRGRAHFAALGCAACHELGPDFTPLASTLPARPLAQLQTSPEAGCLASTPPPTAPRYLLSPAQRTALQETLRSPDLLTRPAPPRERVAKTLASLHCYACHSRDGYGGPDARRADYFESLSDGDLGIEGRIPPHLSAVGDKLRPEWLGTVLTNAGVVRPYMAVRMPQFGAAHVARLAADLIATDAGPAARDAAPAGDAAAGPALVGVTGYSCVQCHRFGPYPSLGISVMDLTRMPPRLNWDWFRRYLADPASLRLGTRMPAFWPEGHASVPDLLEGDPARQMAAIWSYLALGTNAPPPSGLLEGLSAAGALEAGGYE